MIWSDHTGQSCLTSIINNQIAIDLTKENVT